MFALNIKEIDAPELARRLEEEHEQVAVVDVREQVEVAAGTIPGALHVPMRSIPWHAGEFDRNKDLVIICRSGARSAQVCAFLQQQGFENVYNLRGGIIAWARAGLPAALPRSA